VCGRVLAGAMHAVVFQSATVSPTTPGERGFLGLGIEARLAVTVARVIRLEAGLEALAAPLRHSFQLAGSGRVVFTEPLLGGLGYLGAGLAIP